MVPNQFSTSGPHIESPDTIEKNMWSVVFALLPALIAAVYFFGAYSIYLAIGTALSAVIFEKPLVKHKSFLGDGSAFLAGLLLGLTLPPTSPWWIPVIGGFLTIIIGKHLFGGLGNNIFNPALIARAILLLSFPAVMTKWITPLDGVATATPLQQGGQAFEYFELFLGNIPGSIGETSALALIIGGIYLYVQDYIDLRIPLSFLAGSGITAYLFGQDPLYAILAGGIMFGAIYMATDMVTSPVTKWARIAYGLGGGILTILIREFTPYPEGITFAILIMNGSSYLLDTLFEGPRFGEVQFIKRKYVKAGMVILIAVLIGFAGMASKVERPNYPGSLTVHHLETAFEDAKKFELIEQTDSGYIYEAKTDEELLGYIGYMNSNGYEGPIKNLIVFDSEGEIIKTSVIEENESPTLGARIKEKTFLEQFEGFNKNESDVIAEEVETISGATISSQAVSRNVRESMNILANLEDDEDKVSGTFTGEGEGYKGPIEVEVTFENGEITDITVAEHEETEDIAEPAFDDLEEKIKEEQSADVDTISGATNSSKGYLEAVENAIEKSQSEQKSDSASDGTHKGSAEGYKGPIEVEVTFENGEITDITVAEHEETEDIAEPAFDDLEEKIKEEQSADVDTISGATNSSEGYLEAVENAIENSQSEQKSDGFSDGTHKGSAEGYKGPIEVEVEVENGEIIDIEVADHNETEGIGDEAFPKIIEEIISSQEIEVDTVSGATNSSEGLIKAVKDALE